MSTFPKYSQPKVSVTGNDQEKAAATSEVVRQGAVEGLDSSSRSPQNLEKRALELLEEQVFQLKKKFEEYEARSFRRAEATEEETESLGRSNRELLQRPSESEALARGGMAATSQTYETAGKSDSSIRGAAEPSESKVLARGGMAATSQTYEPAGLKFKSDSSIRGAAEPGATRNVGDDQIVQSRQVLGGRVLELEVQALRVRELESQALYLRKLVKGTDPLNVLYRVQWGELFHIEGELDDIHFQALSEEINAEKAAAKQQQEAEAAKELALKKKNSLAAANRAEAKKKLQREQLARERDARAARENTLREGIRGLVEGCPHWDDAAMNAMETLLSITSQDDIDAVHGERPQFLVALKNLVETGEAIIFDHHKLTDYEQVFVNSFYPHLMGTSESIIASVIQRLQKLYWENHVSGRLNLSVENYRRCSMFWYLCLKTMDSYQLSRIIVEKAPVVYQLGTEFRPKYTVENNWTLEESTYVQFKQRAIEVQIGNQAYSLVSDWLKTVTVRSYDLLVGYSFAPKSKYVIKTSAAVDERSLALWKLQERVFVGLSSDVEVGSQLEPTSEFRKETNFDEASKVQQISQISSGGRMSITVSASSKPGNTSPGNGCETQGEFSKQNLVLIGLDDDTAYKDSDTLPALQQSDRIEILTVHADPPDKKPPEYGESCIGWTAEVRPQPPDAEIEKFADVASERYDKSFEYDGDRNRFFEWTFDIFTGQSHVQSWRERVIGWFAEVLPQPPDTFSYWRRSSVLFWIVEICLRPPDPCSSELRFCDFFDTATRMISFL